MRNKTLFTIIHLTILLNLISDSFSLKQDKFSVTSNFSFIRNISNKSFSNSLLEESILNYHSSLNDGVDILSTNNENDLEFYVKIHNPEERLSQALFAQKSASLKEENNMVNEPFLFFSRPNLNDKNVSGTMKKNQPQDGSKGFYLTHPFAFSVIISTIFTIAVFIFFKVWKGRQRTEQDEYENYVFETSNP